MLRLTLKVNISSASSRGWLLGYNPTVCVLRLIHTQGGREYHSTSKRRWKANIIFTWPIEVVTFSPMATHNNTKTVLLPTITSPYKPHLYQNTRVSFGSHNLNFVAPLPLPPQTEGEEGVACGYQQVGVLK